MESQTHEELRERAYLIWERTGRIEGRALDHWLAAEAELARERDKEMRGATRAAKGTAAVKVEPKKRTRSARGGKSGAKESKRSR